MSASGSKVKPILRQFMVSAGVSLSMMEHSVVIGFTTILLPQLRDNPTIQMDDNIASWIASIVGFANIVGTLIAPSIMYRFGRRLTNLVSALTMTVGWICVILSNSANAILIARFIQGVALGLSNLSLSILVGEYTTPRYRGAFLTMMVVALLTGGLLVHSIGSFLPWYRTAIFCVCIAIADSILISLSPDTPVFLASRGRYEECRKVFHWLRGFDEEDELEAMIKAEMINKATKESRITNISICQRSTRNIKQMFLVLNKPEFYKPLILMFHLYMCNVWCGSMLMDAFGVDVFHVLQGKESNMFAMMLSTDIFRLVSTLTAVVLNTKYQRRSMLYIFFNLNILMMFLIAGYSYAKEQQVLLFDHPMIGAGLVYLMVIIAGGGTTTLVNIVAGEVFALQYKTISMLLATLFLSLNVAIMMKSQPYMFSAIGLHGTFCVYGLILGYGTLVGIMLLPETKDRTLQDIEEELWKKRSLKIPLVTELPDLESKNMI